MVRSWAVRGIRRGGGGGILSLRRERRGRVKKKDIPYRDAKRVGLL
jgi:hypothetical protein